MKKALSVLLLVLIVMMLSVTAFADETNGWISGVISGNCGGYDSGDNVKWNLYDDGTLKIDGYGPMANYSETEHSPWYEYKDQITKLVFEGDVNTIGDYAFDGCSKITGELVLPQELDSIGKYAFKNCSGFTGGLSFVRRTELIDDGAFYGCSGFDGELFLGQGVRRVGAKAFMNCTGFAKDSRIPYMVDSFGNNAFTNCGIDNFYFYGDSPDLEEGYEKNHPFDAKKDTIYCRRDDHNFDAGEGKYWYGFTLKENTKDFISGICGAGPGGTNLTWRIDANDTLIISGTGAMTNFIEEGRGPWADYSGYFHKLKVEEGVTSIGDYAFSYCHFSNDDFLVLPSTLEVIDNYAFAGAQIKGSLIIPENVKTIGHYAFYNCKYLDGIISLPHGLETIGAGAFKDCKNVSGVIVIPETVKEISYEAFINCKVNTYYLKCIAPAVQDTTEERPSFDTYDTIHIMPADDASNYTGYTTNYAQEDTIIESGNCGGMGQQIDVKWSITAGGRLTISGKGRMRDFETNYTFVGQGVTTPWHAYSDQISCIIIEEGIEYIGDYAFYTLSNASNIIYIPGSVTGIGDYAFNGCNNLRGELDLPEGLTEIGEAAFGYCWRLSGDLILPSTLTTLGEYAFTACRGFEGKLVLPASLTEIPKSAFDCAYRLSGTLEIPETVTVIRENAFYRCFGFTGDLVIPDSVTTIEYSAFRGCYGFDGKLVLSKNLTTLGDSAFENCSGLTGDLTIPDSVTAFGFSAFTGCKNFDGKLTLGKGMVRIPDYAFEGCEKLDKEITIPANIKYIGGNAFTNCGGKYYTFEGNAPELVYEATDSSASFDAPYDFIAFPEGDSTWVIEDGKWMGYNIGNGFANVVFGDADGNGKINVFDANLIRRHAAKMADITEENLAAADVDANGKINVMDSNTVRRYAARMIDKFPAEE